MKKKINVVPYDNNWPQIFEVFSKEIKDALKENCIKIYHVGSTSVPGLCSKPVIDIMCIVNDLKIAEKKLIQIGYKSKGEFNLPLRLFFSKKHPHDVHIHVVKENSDEIAWNLVFQNYLRKDKNARDMYADVKLNLIKENPDGFNIIEGLFSEYTIKKGEIIRQIAKKAGFNGYRFMILTNRNEIETYKKFMNLEKVDFSNKNTFYLCLYKGIDIVAVACVNFDTNNSIATMKSIKSTNSENQKIMENKINEWVTFHNLSLNKD